ncbi:MAG: hypothetical protein MUE54_02710 [Anaerolineae bacterium]|jgi:hypothetical protein|nr:hypothetical protein [Anaerolineae bacterium]
MFHKAINRSIFFFLLFVVAILPVSAQQRPTPPTPVPPTDSPVLTSAQMRSAIVVSDMRATNRVMVRANEEVVYRLADCDETVENSPCYVVLSASITPTTNTESFSQTQSSTSVNRGRTIQCVRVIYGPGALYEIAWLHQNVAVTFHTNSDSAPLTLNWGDYAGSLGGLFARWVSISNPAPNPGWGTYEWNQAYVNTSALGEYGVYSPIGWITTYTFGAGVRLTINKSGWWCS